MIVGSLLLILVAVVLLVLGLTNGSSLLLTGSIAASLLAAVALVVGARQDAGTAADHPDEVPDDPASLGDTAGQTRQYALAGARSGRAGQDDPYRVGEPVGESATVTLPVQPSGRTGYHTGPPIGSRTAPPAGLAAAGEQELDDEDPPDEPAPQAVSAVDAARVARLTTDVLVIDGRPRYHLPGCVHLLGRENEPIPVGEAVELGFTPCSLCEPDSALLADPRRN